MRETTIRRSQQDTRTRTRDRRTAVAEQTTPEKEAWNMPGTWKRTPPPYTQTHIHTHTHTHTGGGGARHGTDLEEDSPAQLLSALISSA